MNYILINGSTVPSMRARLMAVAAALEDGSLLLHNNAKIFFLDGERPLFASETPDILLDPAPYETEKGWIPPSTLPLDEREAAEMIWKQLRLPSALRAMSPVFVHAVAQPGAPRAETADCIALWLSQYQPLPGAALVVSDQPFVEYQRRVTELIVAQHGVDTLQITAMGPAPSRLQNYDTVLRLGVLLDNFANILHKALLMQKVNSSKCSDS